jgi:hypothetical protein
VGPMHGIIWIVGFCFNKNGIAFFQNVATIENLGPRLHLYLSNVDLKNPGTTTPLQPLGPCDCTSRRGHATVESARWVAAHRSTPVAQRRIACLFFAGINQHM